MSRGSFLIQSDFDRLEDWCRMVRVIFGPVFGPYLVGSARERADYRDVDIRVMVEDRRFDSLFRGRPEAVRFLNRAFSVWGQQETGLPIDFQVQRPQWSSRGIRGVKCQRPAKAEARKNVWKPGATEGRVEWHPVCGVHARRYDDTRPLTRAADAYKEAGG